MAAPEIVNFLIRPFNATGIPYMVTGGTAAILYGEPRLTNDVDVVVDLHPAEAERLLRVFDPADYYGPPIEYVILMKLEYYRQSGSDRHLRDIAAMLRQSGDSVDHGAMTEWSERLGVVREWEVGRDIKRR